MISSKKSTNYFIGALLFIAALGQSCSTEVDITDTSQGDIPVVYGLIDPNQDSHFVKVSRTFLGEEDNFRLAKIKDSSQIGNIQVIIERKIYGELQEVYNLFPVVKQREEDGDFYTGTQTVYAFYDPNLENKILVGEDYYTYELSVYRGDEVIASSSCELVSESPTKSVFQGNSQSGGIRVLNAGMNFTRDIEFTGVQPPGNSKMASLAFFFFYENVYEDGRSEIDSMEFNFGTSILRSNSPSEEMSFSFTGSVFFDRIAQEIPDRADEDGLAYRRILTPNLTFTAATEDLYYYSEVNDPSNSSFQERPDYSNITNGIGLFTSRASTNYSYIRGVEPTLSIGTISALLEGSYERFNEETGEDETILTNTGKKGFCFDSCP